MIKFARLLILPLGLFLLLLYSCGNNSSKRTQKIDNRLEVEDSIIFSELTTEDEVIFYNIFSPIDADIVWRGRSYFYNSKLINPLNNITKYQQSNKIALNLGIYGTDLSYLWMFDQSQQGLSYLSAVQRLSSHLGIPSDFIRITAEAAENNIQNADTLLRLARKAYILSDEHLKKSGQSHAANLILLGGWIESLYIATQMYVEADERLASKIATQKFSLNSLYILLSNNQEDKVTQDYLVLLNSLKGAFDRFETHFDSDQIQIDTLNKRITIPKSDLIDLKRENFKEIKSITIQIRDQIIS